MNSSETAIDRMMDLTEFKTRCLEVLEQLAAPGIILTKEGRPLAKITPLSAPQPPRTHDEVIAEIWKRQQERGYQPPTRAEVDAYLQKDDFAAGAQRSLDPKGPAQGVFVGP